MADRWDRSDIIGLAKREIPAKDIAVQTGCSISTAYLVIRLARQRGDLPPNFSDRGRPATGLAKHLVIQNQVRKMLTSEAAVRGITVSRLCANLLRRIANDQLASAVLDDGFSTPPLPTKGSPHDNSTNA